MCGGVGKAPTQPTVDPAKERQKAADDAAKKANAALVTEARRRRGQQGLLSGDEAGAGSVLSRADPASTSSKVIRSIRSVLGGNE